MIRIGILGAAGIAPQAVIIPARRRDDLAVTAIASRKVESAQRYAAIHGIPTAFGSYEELIASPDIEVVYVALPPSEHARWSTAAMEAGKDVLCEKPITMNASEARQVAAVAERTGRHLIEAFHDHYHPLTGVLAGLGRSSEVGRILSIKTSFTADNPYFPGSIRHVPELGGGALMDLGCYPVHWVRDFMGIEPTVASASYVAGPVGADGVIDAQLKFGDVEVTLHASMAAGVPFAAPFSVTAERGTITVDNLVLPHKGHSVTTAIDGVARTFTVSGAETYDYQLDALVHAVITGEIAATEGHDYVPNMELIDLIYAAAGLQRAS